MNYQEKSHRIVRALLRQPVDRTPVWIMRQAGRYLPEYQMLRNQQPDFFQFCENSELAAEATLQPLQRFPLDAAIVFSDILVLPRAMGVDVQIHPGRGPVVDKPLRDLAAIMQLKEQDVVERLNFVMNTIRFVVEELNGRVPLIGFAGAPWTVATYCVEGGSSRDFIYIKSMLYREPALLHTLLQRLTIATIKYLNAQVKAGAEILMIFDSWAGALSTSAYQEFSLKYLKTIAEKTLREFNGKKIPLIFFAKGAGGWLERIADSGCDAIGIDWTIDLGFARRLVRDRVALQGNLDPMILFADTPTIERAVEEILKNFGKHFGHVFNLGHGIHQQTPVENVTAMIEAVHRYGKHE